MSNDRKRCNAEVNFRLVAARKGSEKRAFNVGLAPSSLRI